MNSSREISSLVTCTSLPYASMFLINQILLSSVVATHQGMPGEKPLKKSLCPGYCPGCQSG